MSSNATPTYTAAAGEAQLNIDAAMLLRFIYDTASLQDRLIQGAAAPNTRANDEKNYDADPKEPKSKL
ncbi:hypothetical protein ACHAPT_009539 [Fusarium lateritium]